MGKTDEIMKFLQYLQNEEILFTEEFVNDIKKLVQTDIPTFATWFYRDFARKNFQSYNRFEKLNLTSKQKARIGNVILWRYEYRKFSNFRCIFVTESEDNIDTPIFYYVPSMKMEIKSKALLRILVILKELLIF